jgi:type I restriction enzyme S subunit
MKKISLSDLINNFESGSRPKGGVVEKGIPSLGGEHISGDGTYKLQNVKYIPEDYFNSLSKGIIEKEDILIVKDGATTGRIAFIDRNYPYEKSAINEHLFKLSINPDKVIPKYIYYYLLSNQGNYELMKDFRGATIGGITRKFVEYVKVPLPKNRELQLKIVNILDKSKDLINKRKAQIEALEQLTQSVFLEMFGDPLKNNKNLSVVPLSNLAKIIMGQSPKGDSYNKKGYGIPLLNGPTEFGVKYPKERQWTTEPKKMCLKDDILFCVRGATAGRMNLADKEYCIGRGLAAIRCNDKNDIPFIFQTLKFLYKHFQSTSDGSTFINIDKNKLNNVPIFKVDKIQLEKYFSVIKKIEEQKIILTKSGLLLEQNFSSIMQRAFKGELFNKDEF